MDAPAPPPFSQPIEGSPEWFSNLQAIQNLMRVLFDYLHSNYRTHANDELLYRSDLHDIILYVVVPHLTYSSPYTYSILALTAVSLAGLLFVLPMIPLRPVFLVLGLLPFAITHPFSREWLPVLLAPYHKRLRQRLTQLADDDRLDDCHLRSKLRTVELWENERLGPGSNGPATFDKSNLKPSERKGWTRGRDGWSDSGSEGKGDVRSVLIFSGSE